MEVLDYYTPRKTKPFPIRLTGGLRADTFILIRGFFLAVFLLCLLTGEKKIGIVSTTGDVWLAEWKPDCQILLMRLDPAYAERLDGGWQIWRAAPPDFVDSIQSVGTIKTVAGVEVGSWPYARWISIPFPPTIVFCAIALLLVWRFTRLPPAPPIQTKACRHHRRDPLLKT